MAHATAAETCKSSFGLATSSLLLDVQRLSHKLPRIPIAQFPNFTFTHNVYAIGLFGDALNFFLLHSFPN